MQHHQLNLWNRVMVIHVNRLQLITVQFNNVCNQIRKLLIFKDQLVMFNQSCSQDAINNLPMTYPKKWHAYLLVETAVVFWIVSLEFIKIMLISNFHN